MPISEHYLHALDRLIPDIVKQFGSPFYLFDERGIVGTIERMKTSIFTREGDTNLFAVKACPSLVMLKIMLDHGFGLDCSSPFELRMAELVGAPSERVMFTSNNTSRDSLDFAIRYGCVINIDDLSILDAVSEVPEMICFRYNPGNLRRDGANAIIGDPPNQKFGIPHDRIVDAYREAFRRGSRRFGMHAMYVSNQRDIGVLAGTLDMLLRQIERVQDDLGIRFEFVNVGGGFGIPYRPDEEPLDIVRLGEEYVGLLEAFEARNGYRPKLYAESGRYVTGPSGVLVGTVINVMEKYKTFVGVDFSELANIARAAIYPAYHHITVMGEDVDTRQRSVVEVVGPLCENFRLAGTRELPMPRVGDHIVVHDTGAHVNGLVSSYNGWPQAQQLLLRTDGSVVRIARAAKFDDYVRTQIET